MSGVDLIAFVSARLGEDEAAAKSAGGDEWALDDPVRYPGRVVSATHVITDYGGLPDEQAAHIARHDPARALREVEAMRAILAEHHPATPDIGPWKGEPCCGRCGAVGDDAWYAVAWPCDTLKALAAVWGDHPDYDPAWATP